MASRCGDYPGRVVNVGGVSSVLEPVGPEPPSVYWRRRLVVILAAVVVLAFIIFLLSNLFGGSSDDQVVATPVESPTATVDPGAVRECTDADLEVTASLRDDATSFPQGDPIEFDINIKNISSEPCTRNVGTDNNSFEVTSGSVRVWNSDDCAAETTAAVETLPAVAATGEFYRAFVVWDQVISQEGCPAGQPSAQPGTYEVIATNGDVSSAPLTFVIS